MGEDEQDDGRFLVKLEEKQEGFSSLYKLQMPQNGKKRKDNKSKSSQSSIIHAFSCPSWTSGLMHLDHVQILTFLQRVQKHQRQKGNPPMLICFPPSCCLAPLFPAILHVIDRMDSEKLVHVPCAALKVRRGLGTDFEAEELKFCFQMAALQQRTFESYYNFS